MLDCVYITRQNLRRPAHLSSLIMSPAVDLFEPAHHHCSIGAKRQHLWLEQIRDRAFFRRAKLGESVHGVLRAVPGAGR